MKAHELARLLLAGPDVPVLTGSRDGWNEAKAPEVQIASKHGEGYCKWWIEYYPELPPDEDDPPRMEVVTL